MKKVKRSNKIVRATQRDVDVVYCRLGAGARINASEPWEMGKQVEFMYMPAGVTTITAGFRDAAIQLTVSCDKSTANIVQASYEQWLEQYPKQKPFGCVEHREEEASVLPLGFNWRDEGDAGVYMAAEPTELGAKNVNGKIHRSWSPSFLTDADYSKAKLGADGVYRFPDGVRGSASNPAKIKGCAFCVGTLTNKPAFRNISPVKAKQAGGSEDEVHAGAPIGNRNAAGRHEGVVHLPLHEVTIYRRDPSSAERIFVGGKDQRVRRESVALDNVPHNYVADNYGDGVTVGQLSHPHTDDLLPLAQEQHGKDVVGIGGFTWAKMESANHALGFSIGQDARKQSRRAQTASDMAEGQGEDSHARAAQEHRDAMIAHSKAAEYGSKLNRAYHLEQVGYHSDASARHSERSGGAKATDASPDNDAVHAGAPIGNRNAAGEHKASKVYQAAVKSSSRADLHTRLAYKTGHAEDHARASELHTAAVRLHKKAASHARQIGDAKSESFHKKSMETHDNSASEHALRVHDRTMEDMFGEDADKYDATDATPEDNAVKTATDKALSPADKILADAAEKRRKMNESLNAAWRKNLGLPATASTGTGTVDTVLASATPENKRVEQALAKSVKVNKVDTAEDILARLSRTEALRRNN